MTTTQNQTTITREALEDAGWTKDGACWMNPYNGELCSFEEARQQEEEERQAQTELEGL